MLKGYKWMDGSLTANNIAILIANDNDVLLMC